MPVDSPIKQLLFSASYSILDPHFHFLFSLTKTIISTKKSLCETLWYRQRIFFGTIRSVSGFLPPFWDGKLQFILSYHEN
jgi:hypothetical protein